MRTPMASLVAANALAMFWACSSDEPAGPSAGAASIVGQVVDVDGAGLVGVKVTGGGASATSAAEGRFSLAAAAGDVVVTFTSTGYVRTVESLNASSDAPAHIRVTMVRKAAALPLDADSGGTVSGPRGASLTAPPSAFVVPATGEVAKGTIRRRATSSSRWPAPATTTAPTRRCRTAAKRDHPDVPAAPLVSPGAASFGSPRLRTESGDEPDRGVAGPQ